MELKIRGYTVLFDDEDADLVLGYGWYLSNCKGYLYATTKRIIRMHKLVLGNPKGDVDHQNKNTLDNHKSNLRPCSRAQNNANSGSRRGSSRYKGVSWNKGKWRATIMLNYKQVSLGRFDSEIEAAAAYDAAAKAAWGEFAYQNLVDEHL